MIARALAVHSPRAVRNALIARGWDEVKSDAAAAGVAAAAVELAGLSPDTVLALVAYAGRLGLDLMSGEDWVILAGSEARLGALARPWTAPPALAEAAGAVGRLLASDVPERWVTASGTLPLDRPVLVGILNVTPDSFSDGGHFATLDAALAQSDRLLAEGATVVDIGGESTRPGSEPVPEEEELRRIVPVIGAIARRHPGLCISADTVKATVARAALEAGASVINDVSAFRLDPGMARVAAACGAGVILMHSRGTVSTMARLDHAVYEPDVVTGVVAELREALERATAGGVKPERIVLDPGFGFAKTGEHNLALCDGLAMLKALGRPLLVGPSRKRFLGTVTGREIPDRDIATASACVMAWERGARLFRVHNVAATRDALAVAAAVRGAQ